VGRYYADESLRRLTSSAPDLDPEQPGGWARKDQGHRRPGGGEGKPAPAGSQGDRDKQGMVGLVVQHPQRDAGDD